MIKRTVTPIDKGWSFKRFDDASSAFLPVSQFPTNIHLDLLHHNLIPDPFIGKNEDDVQWVGEKAWVYRTTFSASPTKNTKSMLAFDGLDTFATVVLNGKVILRTEDMFIPERVDVSKVLQVEKENVLEITFESAWFKGKEIVEKFPHHHWGCWNGDVSRLAVRKAQYHYGWDWGPVLMTCGPWRPVHLEVYSSCISDLYSTIDVDSSLQTAKLVAKAEVEGDSSALRFELSLEANLVSTEEVKVADGLATATFHVENPELWYPASYGKQPLYTLTATLVSGDIVLDVKSKRIGIRSARVVQKKLKDAPGTTFYFEINNIPVFCGGSGWIPADNFIPRITSEKYRDWIKLAVEGNQIMIRVWGGGIFEEQAFYEACDEMGVLVWQDFLFGCGNYPGNEEFLKLVKREAIANVKLLRHHPSIVIWAGNNEDYQYRESENLDYDAENHNAESWLTTNFPARYIYEKILVDVTQELVPETYYHFGCPFGGKDTRDPTVGDIHQWNVWHGTQEPYQNFSALSGRFVSEFGMQALPPPRTIHSFLPSGSSDPEAYAQSSTLDHHNKADGQERRLALYLVENIRYSPEPLTDYIYSTQLMQAECLSSAYRLWRREWKGPGREYCAGALVWQLNDCWPGTSWAIADYYLRPKLAYWAIKREMAKVTVGMKRRVERKQGKKWSRVDVEKLHKLEVWASNLGLEKRTVDVKLVAWDVETGEETFKEVLKEGCVLEENKSMEIAELEIPVRSKNNEEESRTVIAAYLLEDGKQVARYINWPEPLKYLHLQKPRALKVRLIEDGSVVELEAEVPIKGLALEVEGKEVRWEDNGIDVVPGEAMRVGVKGLSIGEERMIGVKYLT